jgi:hypothetical protein
MPKNRRAIPLLKGYQLVSSDTKVESGNRLDSPVTIFATSDVLLAEMWGKIARSE